ncbi:MAG: hypothetical protein JXA18_02935 [Chitinispirillaceae bacterium]|nr:hypothetical protein [Chitinispirillaceae bacterium]
MSAGSMQPAGLRRCAGGHFAMIAGMVVAVLVQRPLYGECSNDNDCKGDRICVNSRCVDPAPQPDVNDTPAVETLPIDTLKPQTTDSRPETIGATTEAPEVEKIEDDEDDEARETFPEPGLWDIWFNPVGFIQFGPTAGVEFRTAPNLYIGLHSRYAAMGMLYNLLLESRAESETNWNVSTIEVYPQSAAAGLELKYYITFPSRPHMLYFGMFGEYMWGGYTAFEDAYYSGSSYNEYEDEKLYEAWHQSVGMGATIGHRWRFGESRKVLFTVGLITGVARPFASTKEYYSQIDRSRIDRKVDLPKRNEFIFMAEVGIGYGM